MSNNPILFNAALAGSAAGVSSRWLVSATQSDYVNPTDVVQAFAAALDTAIPTIAGGATQAQGRVIASLCNAFWTDRFPQSEVQADYTDEAASIAALFQELRTNLESEGDSGIEVPLGNTLYVNPNSTISPATGSILAPFTTIQVALNTIVIGEQWTIIIPPGIEIVENLTVPAGAYVEICALGLDEGSLITGDITWNANNAFFGLTNCFLEGDIGGVTAGAASTLIIQNCIINGSITFTGAVPLHIYLNGSLAVDPNVPLGFDFGQVSGSINTNGGDLRANNMALRGTSLTLSRGIFENCVIGTSGGTNVDITASGPNLVIEDCQLQRLNSLVFSGAAGTLELDGQSFYYFNASKPTFTNGSILLLENDVKFGRVLPNAAADIDPALGGLFEVYNITAGRNYTLIPSTATVNQTVITECRNTSAFTPALMNGGAAPGLLVNMVNGFAYVAVYDGANFNYTGNYPINY